MKKTILIVDDQLELMEVLRAFLVSDGYRVLMADCGDEAMEFIASGNPIDLILMDVMLPCENGYSITQRIRELELPLYIPILMLTAKVELPDVVKGFESGADDYIKKPYDLKEIRARISAHLRRSEIMNNSIEHEQIRDIEPSIDTNETLEKQVFYLTNLFEMSHELHSDLEFDKLLNNALFSLISHLAAKSASIIYRNESKSLEIQPLLTRGLLAKDFNKLGFYITPVIENYFLKNKFILLNKIDESHVLYKVLKPFIKLDLELMIPLKRQNILDGFVLLGGRIKGKSYRTDELSVLTLYMDALAVAIMNSKHHEDIKTLSYTDAKTGIHNDRYLALRLSEEYARAIRMGTPLSVIVIDIDFFKNYNDTLGHLAGDKAIRQVAQILNSTGREEDIVCRYGGEEFCIILPNTKQDDAYSVAQRLRLRIEESVFDKEEIQPGGQLTCSFGVAGLSPHIKEARDLLDKADKAMYGVKKSGRNNVIIYKNLIEETV